MSCANTSPLACSAHKALGSLCTGTAPAPCTGQGSAESRIKTAESCLFTLGAECGVMERMRAWGPARLWQKHSHSRAKAAPAQPQTGGLMSKVALGSLRKGSESVFPFLLCFYPFHIQKIHGQYLPPFSFEGNNSPKPPHPSVRSARISQGEQLQHSHSWWQRAQNVHTVSFWGFFSFPLAEYSISAAAIAIFSVGFAIIGTICVLLSFRKKRDYLLKPASMFYTFAGTRRAAHISALGS